MQLPPKRYQKYDDPKYDSIRPKPWFEQLKERREKIPILEQTAKIWFENNNLNQAQTCQVMGVDEREFRDYIAFRERVSKVRQLPEPVRRSYQFLLDQAYDVYRDTGAERAFTVEIYRQGPIVGVNPRVVIELWETDPTWYPTQYRGQK